MFLRFFASLRQNADVAASTRGCPMDVQARDGRVCLLAAILLKDGWLASFCGFSTMSLGL